jgi:hypothetical protein
VDSTGKVMGRLTIDEIVDVAEPRNTASQALRFSPGFLCGSSLPDGIANLLQSPSFPVS